MEKIGEKEVARWDNISKVLFPGLLAKVELGRVVGERTEWQKVDDPLLGYVHMYGAEVVWSPYSFRTTVFFSKPVTCVMREVEEKRRVRAKFSLRVSVSQVSTPQSAALGFARTPVPSPAEPNPGRPAS